MLSVISHLTARMNLFKRATTSILRRLSKTIILLLLVFILGTVIAGAISARSAINNIDANLRRRMPPIVSIVFDDMAWSESIDWDEIDSEDDLTTGSWITLESLTLAHIHDVGALPYVAFYDYIISSTLRSFELQHYTGAMSDYEDEMDYYEDAMYDYEYATEWDFHEGEFPEYFNLRGTSRTELVKIEEGMINLVEGRQFESDELISGAETSVAIISEAFANENNLSLGSTFELYEFIHFPLTPEEEDYVWDWNPEMYADENIYVRVDMEFMVIGLYDIPVDLDQDSEDSEREEERISNLNYM